MQYSARRSGWANTPRVASGTQFAPCAGEPTQKPRYDDFMAKQVRRVLVYRIGSLGDTVVALPALHLIARAFPDATRLMLTNFPVNVKAPAAAAILGESGLIHGYLRYVVGTRSLKELAKLWWSIVRFRPQVLIYLGPARGIAAAKRDSHFFRMCGIFQQIGIPLTEAMQRNLFQAATAALEPECERLVRNLSALGDGKLSSPEAWDLHLTEQERSRACELLGLEAAAKPARPIVVVCAGSKWQSKDWGVANWQQLVSRMARENPDRTLVLIGAPEERALSESVAQAWHQEVQASGLENRAINLCGITTPRETAACLERAQLFIGHDSGPMHLAAAVGTPCLAIFAAINLPRVWFPYGPGHRVVYHSVECAGCGLETCIVEKKRCLTSVSVDEVESSVQKCSERSSHRLQRVVHSAKVASQGV